MILVILTILGVQFSSNNYIYIIVEQTFRIFSSCKIETLTTGQLPTSLFP
jgi:hypothetical protein